MKENRCKNWLRVDKLYENNSKKDQAIEKLKEKLNYQRKLINKLKIITLYIPVARSF